MKSISMPVHLSNSQFLQPILVGGAIAGTLDLASAFITLGLNTPKGIAGGLLGRHAQQGGTGTWILGVILYFLIAFSAAAIYCVASRKLEFLKDHWLVCGLFYGIAIYLVMFLVVLPLSALGHSAARRRAESEPYQYMGPYQYKGLFHGILVHMFIIGLPISFSLRKLYS